LIIITKEMLSKSKDLLRTYYITLRIYIYILL